MKLRSLFLTLAFSSVVLSGCRHSLCRRNPPDACPPPVRGSTIPPAGIPEGPPPMAPIPRGAAPDSGASELLLPQPPPGKTRSEYPRVVPAESRGAILGDPDYAEPPKIVDADPALVEEKKAVPANAASGIPDFTQIKEGVSAGGRPALDGLDWLKTKGYKTVVYLRRTSDDDLTDRRQVERRDMKFVSILVTPEGLTQAWLDEFNRTVGDTVSRPIYIYASDANVAGVVWYLHLRTAEFLTHDEARVRAGRLGLKDEKSELFLAAVKLVPVN